MNKKKIFLFFIFFTATVNCEDRLNLKKCIDIAIKYNIEIEMAERNYKASKIVEKQAKGARYPNIELSGMALKLHKDPKFTIPGFNISLAGNNFPVPEQEIKLADDISYLSSLDFNLPIYTGGLVTSYIDQSKVYSEIQLKVKERKIDEIKFNVKKYYYTYLMFAKMSVLLDDYIESYEVNVDLVKSLYEKGSGSVNKIDYLEAKQLQNTLMAVNNEIKKNMKMSKIAILFYIGKPNAMEYEIEEGEYNFNQLDEICEEISLDSLESKELTLVELASKYYEAKYNEAKSKALPKLGVFGGISYLENSYEHGFVNGNNISWRAGIGASYNVFDGNITRNRIKKAKLDYENSVSNIKFAKQGIMTKIITQKFSIINTLDSLKLSEKNNEISEEVLDLNMKAYKIGMIEFEKVIMAQFKKLISDVFFELTQYKLQNLVIEYELLVGD